MNSRETMTLKKNITFVYKYLDTIEIVHFHVREMKENKERIKKHSLK